MVVMLREGKVGGDRREGGDVGGQYKQLMDLLIHLNPLTWMPSHSSPAYLSFLSVGICSLL